MGQLRGEREGQRGERPAGHVHLLGGQFAAGDVVRQGVGELDAEREAGRRGTVGEPAEHGDGVVELEVATEVVVVEGDVGVAEVVEDGAGGVVPQHRGVGLDEGVEALVEEVGGDALDLAGGATVEGGEGDRVGDVRGEPGEVVSAEALEPVQVGLQPGERLAVRGGGGGVPEALEEAVDEGGADALQVVADGRVVRDVVAVADPEFHGEHADRDVGADVLVKGLADRELGGPLAVEALVLRVDARLGDGGADRLPVHHLHGLQLDEAGAGEVGRDDVGGELGVGAGGRADWRGERVVHGIVDGPARGRVEHVLGTEPEHCPVRAVLLEGPGHERAEREWTHQVAHVSHLHVAVAFHTFDRAPSGGRCRGTWGPSRYPAATRALNSVIISSHSDG